MRRYLAYLAFLVTLATPAFGDLYRVTVSRIDKDLYKDHDSGLIIETKYCYEYAIRDEAVLRYERYGYNNKLIFSSGTTCDVKAIR